MKFAHLFLGIIMAVSAPAVCSAQTSLPIKLVAPPAGSGIDQTYDEATNTYTLYVRENNWNDVKPIIEFEALASALDPELRTIAFEFVSDKPMSSEILRLEKVFNGKFNREYEFNYRTEITSEWTPFRIPVGEYRDLKSVKFGDAAGQVVKLTLRDLVTGTTFKIRNLRYEADQQPFKDIQVTAGTTVVEAEDFLISSEGKGAASRNVNIDFHEYCHPVNPGEMPIMAWLGFTVSTGNQDDMNRIKQGYKDMAECGFNMTQGPNYFGVMAACLFHDREVNGYYIDVIPEDVNVRLLISGLNNYNEISEWVPQFMKSEKLAGYYIRDEPFAQHIDEMKDRCQMIREFDKSHLCYGNLFSSACNSKEYGFSSWEEYVERYFEKTGISFLSYDIYPVHQSLTTGEIYVMPEYYENLEIANRLSRYYGVPFWAFVHSCSCEFATGGYGNPKPTEEYMRYQAFGNLAYGAQGISYYPYCTPAPWAEGINYQNGPISFAGEKTDTWYMCQNINREIHALEWVFVGAECIAAGHTNDVTPKGCRKLSADMLPAGITSVKSSGTGILATTLQNGRNKFLMVVNSDILAEQTVTVNTTTATKRVLADGTLSNQAMGDVVATLPVGGYLLLLVDDNAEPIVHYGRAGSSDLVDANYRFDQGKLHIVADANVSNGHYIANMGSDGWEAYSLTMSADKNCVISREEALENWGHSFSYIVEVPEEIDVNVSVGHSVPWDKYGQVAAIGARPGFSYIIEDEPTLNWPQKYAASMTLALDGDVIKPSNQSARPVAPTTYDPDGVEFNAILADKSRWTSTEGDDNLYFWPKAGGDNTFEVRYNDKPDYVAVHLTPGRHVFTVNSYCYPWHFDNLVLTDTKTSGIDNLNDSNRSQLTVSGVKGGLLVDADAAFTVYNVSGVAVANGTGSELIELPAGLYVVVSGNSSVKAVAK